MIIPLSILFYAGLIAINMALTTAAFEMIREPNTFKNFLGLVIIIQAVVVDYIAVKQFNKFINKLKQIKNEKSN